MPAFYRRQGEVETLSVKTGIASYRLSEQRQVLYGGRGNRYAELVYLRRQNTSASAVDTKHSDAWHKFATGRSIPVSRSDQEQREFMEFGSYP